jgi:hypothetical protein
MEPAAVASVVIGGYAGPSSSSPSPAANGTSRPTAGFFFVFIAVANAAVDAARRWHRD